MHWEITPMHHVNITSVSDNDENRKTNNNNNKSVIRTPTPTSKMFMLHSFSIHVLMLMLMLIPNFILKCCFAARCNKESERAMGCESVKMLNVHSTKSVVVLQGSSTCEWAPLMCCVCVCAVLFCNVSIGRHTIASSSHFAYGNNNRSFEPWKQVNQEREVKQ